MAPQGWFVMVRVTTWHRRCVTYTGCLWSSASFQNVFGNGQTIHLHYVKSTDHEPFQTDIDLRRNCRSWTDANICDHGWTVEWTCGTNRSSRPTMHEWSDSIGVEMSTDRTHNSTACDENINSVTSTMCCSNYAYVLNEPVLVKNIEKLDGGRVGSNVQMNV